MFGNTSQGVYDVLRLKCFKVNMMEIFVEGWRYFQELWFFQYHERVVVGLGSPLIVVGFDFRLFNDYVRKD